MKENKKDEILRKLSENVNTFVSSKELCDIYNVSRTTIWKYINSIKNDGFDIESSSKKGYRLIQNQDRINVHIIKNGLDSKLIGKDILYFDEIDSTNTKGNLLAQEGCSNGTVIIANTQTKGRGRMGRTWYSLADRGVWMSIIVRPDLLPEEAQLITLAVSNSVSRAIYNTTKINSGIKWPNDILIDGKKVCGILTEMNAEVDRINYIIIGIGLNVKHSKNDYPDEIIDKSVSLEDFLRINNNCENISRNVIIRNVLNELEKDYMLLLEKKYKNILDEWKKRTVVIGKSIEVTGKGFTYEGRVLDISDKGKLIVQLDSGEVREFASGEISIIKK